MCSSLQVVWHFSECTAQVIDVARGPMVTCYRGCNHHVQAAERGAVHDEVLVPCHLLDGARWGTWQRRAAMVPPQRHNGKGQLWLASAAVQRPGTHAEHGFV